MDAHGVQVAHLLSEELLVVLYLLRVLTVLAEPHDVVGSLNGKLDVSYLVRR